MDDLFQLSEEHAMVLDTVRRLVQDEAGPQALENDEHRRFVKPGFDAIAELGLLGAVVGESAGGAGLGHVALVIALEELAKGCGSSARLFLTQAGVVARALEGLDRATESLEQVMTGAAVVGFVGPEHRFTAKANGDGFVLDGHADVVTAAGEANLLVVAAAVDGGHALFVVPAGEARIDAVHSLGYRACAPAAVSFDGVQVAGEACVADGDDAKAALARADLAAWIGGGAIGSGSAFASVELARRHAEERIAFGKPLARQQAVRHKLVDGKKLADAARVLTWQAARRADAGADAGELARIARLAAVEAAVHAADEAIQIHGGYGFTAEYHVERHYRDAKTLEVLDGGAQALRDALMV